MKVRVGVVPRRGGQKEHSCSMIPDIKLHLLCSIWRCQEVAIYFIFWLSIRVAGKNKVPGASPCLGHHTLQQDQSQSLGVW